MLQFNYVTIEMKCGVNFTIYKGGKKNKKDPISYRVIPL